MRYDAIIIGSGVGGLSCALSLSLMGKKVLVLEQAEAVGGCLRGFQHGPWRWDYGCQYTGRMFKDNLEFELMSRLTEGEVSFKRLPAEWQKVVFPDFDYTLVADGDGMKQKLQRDFPAEREHLETYFRHADRIVATFEQILKIKRFSRPLAKFFFPFVAARLLSFVGRTHEEQLDRLFRDTRLKAILSAHWSSAGFPPAIAPFIAYAVTQQLLTDAVFYPNGTGAAIVDALEKRLKAMGAEVRVGGSAGKVDEILLEGRRAVGVKSADGTSSYADIIVSNAGIRETIDGLVPRGRYPAWLVRDLNKRVTSVSSLELRIGFEGDLSSFTSPGKTYRCFSSEPYSLDGDPTLEGWEPSNTLMVFSSLTDARHTDPAHHTAQLVSLSRYRHFEKYLPERGPGYEAAKQKITEDLIEKVLLKVIPPRERSIKELIRYTELTTPIDHQARTFHDKGAMYGLACTSQEIRDMNLLPQSGLKNLYFTGADVFAQGFMQCFVSGVLTASAILRKNLFRELLKVPPRDSKPVILQ